MPMVRFAGTTRSRRLIRWCAAAVVAFFAATLILAPDLRAITIAEEEELSGKVMDQVLRQFRLIQDPFAVQYVDQVSRKIIEQLPKQPFAFHFYIIDSDVENAFATPAGHIFINSGLLTAMDGEDDMAGILAHEMAHVMCRHISDKIERAKAISIATLAGLAAGIFLGSSGSAQLGNAVVVGSTAAGATAQLAYSREDEMQADRLGLQYLKAAGYGAEGLVGILKKMREKTWYGPSEVPTYMMTHPATEDRIAYISSWIEGTGYRPPVPPERQQRFARFQSRLTALYGDPKVSLARYGEAVREHPDDAEANHLYALVLAETGDRQAAIDHLRTALQRRPFDAEILQDMGRIYFQDGRYPQAIDVLRSAITLNRESLEARFYLGRAYLETDRFDEAQRVFSEIIEKEPQFNQARFYLGNAYGKQGRLADAHYHLGLYYMEERQYKNASVQLTKALELTTDEGRRAELQRRLKALRKKIPSPVDQVSPRPGAFRSGRSGKTAW